MYSTRAKIRNIEVASHVERGVFSSRFWLVYQIGICLRPPRAFTRPKKYAEPRRQFRDVVRESKFTYVSQKPLVPHAAGIQREFPTLYCSKAPFGALLVFTLLRAYQLSRNSEITARYQARYEEHSQPIPGALRSIFKADFWVDRNRGNFWSQPGHRVPPSDLGFSIQIQNFQKLQKFDFHQFLNLYDARGSWSNIAKMSEKDIIKSAASGIPKLDRTNYVQWCVDVQLLLEEKGIWSFAVGKQEEPPATASAQEKQKFAKDKAKSRAIILQSLVSRLQPAAMKCEDTQAVWLHLKKLFEPSLIARKASLVETFYGIHRLENEELDTFISRLEKAEDDFIAANAKFPKTRSKPTFCSNVLERILNCRSNQSTNSRKSTSPTRRKLSEKSLEAAMAYSLSLKGHSVVSDSGVSSSDSKACLQSITCYNCGIKGRDCTKPKVPRSQQPQQGQPQQQGRGRGRGRRRGGRQAPSVPAERHKPQSPWFANEPGEPTVPKSPQVCSASADVISTTWYMDSCASHNVCGNRKMFCEFEELQPMRLELGEGSSSITGRGTIELIVQVQRAPHEIKLLNVYFMKNFKRNLISIGKIDCAKYHVSIYNNLMKVYKNNSRVCSLYGKLEDGLYRIQGPVKYRQSNNSSLNKSETRATLPSPMDKPKNYSVSVNMWHQRFGHMYTKGLNYLLNNVNVKGIELHQKVSNAICDNCELSKSTRTGFKSESLLVASEPLELLHMDLWGPCPVPSLRKAKYLLCVVDDATRYTWIFPLRSKDQVFETYKKFHARIERSTGKKVKAIRTDQGGEYRSSPNESSDMEDEFPPPIAPRPARTLPAPPPVAPATVPPPAIQKFATQHIPPFVSTRKKDFSISTTSLRPTSVAHRVPVPHKPGWEREEVQRQSGATKGQWDVYYYAPGLRTALRSGPDIKAWCEVHLKEKYKADEYDFNPTHAVDSDSDDDVEQPRDAEVEPEVDNCEAETYSVCVYCAKLREPSTYEEAMPSPESPVTKLLGIEFKRNDKHLLFHQSGFIKKLAEGYRVVPNKLIKVPITVGTTLNTCKDSEVESDFPYRNLIGSLMFLASRTRLDILYSTIYLSQFNTRHSSQHVKCLLQVLQYVVNTQDYCFNLSSCLDESMHMYCDASWATDL
uniref:Integrase catalytic domain-containing protein n=1 Tax=Strigamia maritima TaxID=126957 RepID=T1II51_STRMM